MWGNALPTLLAKYDVRLSFLYMSIPSTAAAEAAPAAAGAGAAPGTPVLVGGVRTRVVGRVSMDMITVDITELPEAKIGSEVTLWGQGPNGACLSIDEVAHPAGTVGYELMCALARRVPVQVVEG